MVPGTEGHYRSRILADKTYRSRKNLYCKQYRIRITAPALGCSRKEDGEKAQDYWDKCERVKVECKFSLAKRKCGMGLIAAKQQETATHVMSCLFWY
mgnify:CR=1 FL=1